MGTTELFAIFDMLRLGRRAAVHSAFWDPAVRALLPGRNERGRDCAHPKRELQLLRVALQEHLQGGHRPGLQAHRRQPRGPPDVGPGPNPSARARAWHVERRLISTDAQTRRCKNMEIAMLVRDPARAV
eukprot:1561314-Rhodomonas_salina.2